MEDGFPLSPSQLWDAVLVQLRLQVSQPVFDTWLSHTRSRAVDGDTLLVEAPNSFIVESIEKRMWQSVVQAVQAVSGRPLDVRFFVTEEAEGAAAREAPPTLSDTASMLWVQYRFGGADAFVAKHGVEAVLDAVQGISPKARNPAGLLRYLLEGGLK